MGNLLYVLLIGGTAFYLFFGRSYQSPAEREMWKRLYESGIDRYANYRVTYKNGTKVVIQGSSLISLMSQEGVQIEKYEKIRP